MAHEIHLFAPSGQRIARIRRVNEFHPGTHVFVHYDEINQDGADVHELLPGGKTRFLYRWNRYGLLSHEEKALPWYPFRELRWEVVE